MDEKIIIGIDFGSSRTGYAYAVKGKIYTCKFDGTGEKVKTLNEVILNDSNEIIEYGFKVKEYIKKGKLKNNDHYYKEIKMNLYNNIYKIKSVNDNKEIDIEELISIILKYLKEHAIKSIKEENNDLEINDNIKWILTVPAIWDEKNKNIMMRAAKKAGILNEDNINLFFALEPESASLYCLKELHIKDDLLHAPYIVCDLGAGTADIVCHERVFIEEEERIIEKCTPKGGPFGSDEINKQFKGKVLKLLFGEDAIKFNEKFIGNLKDDLKKKILNLYIKLEEEINLFKESITDDYLNETWPIDCTLFWKIKENLSIKEVVENFNKNCKEDWKIKDYEEEDNKTIYFPYTIIYDLIKNITDEIIKILIEIIKKVDNVSSIFYVGGFCNSNFVFNLIKDAIKKDYPNIKHIRPNQCDNAVLKGSVYYGLEPEKIKIRKAKFSLGINTYLGWEDKYEKGGKKIFDKEYNGYVCENSFDTFISKGDDIPYNNRIIKPFTLRDYGNNTYGSTIIIYKSPNPNTLFIDEEGVEEIGRFNLNVSGGDYKGDIFLITLEIGGTFLNASAFHRNSNTRISMEFKY